MSIKKSDDNKQVQLAFLLPHSLREEFLTAAAANDRTAAVLLRDFIREYVKDHRKADRQGTPL